MNQIIKIFTGSWRTAIDDTKFQRVAISRGVPRGRQPGASGYRRYAKLAPGPWFSEPLPPTEWAARYLAENLSVLNPVKTVAELQALSPKGLPLVPLCWETAGRGEWCHRALISRWLKDHLDLDVPELGDPACSCGHDHPLLPEILRRQS